MMLILLVVYWILGVLASQDEPSKENKYVIKRIRTCPAVGYFFRREANPNLLDKTLCYLCFCQNDGTAVCWPRENKRCDAAHYHHGLGKRDITTRVRRSPIGLTDLFFRDSARDIFNKQVPETCKPYETSFSEGCPPADWCTGCTVCDCDANGRWDCHILSFCPDKKDKNKLKTRKKRLRDEIPRRTTLAAPITTTNKKPPKRTPVPKQTTVNTRKQVIHNVKNVSLVKPPNSLVKQPNKTIKQIKKIKQKTNNNIQKRSNSSPKPLIIKKEVSKNPVVVNSQKHQLNDADKITQEVYKKVVSAMQTFLEKRLSAIPAKPTVKSVQKRAMVKRSTKNIKNIKNAMQKIIGQYQHISNKKKYTKPVKPKDNNQKNIKNANHSVKTNKNGVTTNKQTKPTMANEKRIKRDASDYNITETVVIENSTYINAGFPESLPNSKITENETITTATGTYNYYKYSMITPTLSIVTSNPEEYQIVYALGKNKTDNYNITHAHKKRDKENRFDEIEAIVLNSSTADLKKYNILDEKQISVDKAQPDFNDLKFKNWPQVKLLKNRLLMNKIASVNYTNNATKVSNLTEVKQVSTVKKHLKTKDVTRIVVSPPLRKYNRSKLINTLSCNTIHSPKRNDTNFKEHIYHKIDDLQNVLKRVLGEIRKKNSSPIKENRKKFSIIKYLKKFFNRIFRRYRNKERYNSNEQIELDNHIIDSICESFSNCDMSQKDNKKLKTKIRELNSESYTIIRTIKIIKGLLHLLDVPNNTKFNYNPNLNSNKGKSSLKADIHKLNAVLKDKYTNNNIPLTSTQMTQIRYIKNNTQLFVHSVGRFASILHEIITILTRKRIIEDKSKQVFKPAKRSFENNGTRKNDTDAGFKRLKGLLVKYNLIQSSFVRKMYNLLSKFEKEHDNHTKSKASNENKATTAAIDHLSRNIINNLKKLKTLTKVLNSRRQKRDAMRDDDAMEYLLTLMEYLLKQNYPLDVAPVNDGIDLLIEAIKSAPDIKPIKKKVLQMPVNIRISRTTEPVPLSMIREEDSLADSRRVNEDSAANDTRSETGEQSAYHEEEKDDIFKYHTDKNIIETGATANTEVYFNKGVPVIISNPIDTTVIPGPYGIFGNVEDTTTEHNNFKKFENVAKENSKKFEVFNSELDDEDVEVTSSTTATDIVTDTETTVTGTVPLETTEFTLADVKTKQFNINSGDVSGNSDGDKRVGLDWLDEGYDDSKEVKPAQIITTTQTEAPVITTTEVIHTENASTLTKEVSDEEEKKRKAKINVEEVMFKKQMDLLNSLDYGTERAEVEDTESKEGDERYSGDAFPSYFA